MSRNPPVEALAVSRATGFDYDEAFSRNLGWVTEWEQQMLRSKRVAIAGMGGVGGAHLLALTRLGIGKFHVADMDVFDTVNTNRQAGASTSTQGRPKVQVMADMALDINPTAQIRRFEQGVTQENIDEFLDGVDLFVDGFDFFVLDMRARVFARCAELGIPAVTAAPIGMGAAYLVFMPGGMTFEQYFGLNGRPIEQQYVNFLVGLAPKGLHRTYLADRSRVDLVGKRTPSTGMACQMCAGVIGVEVLRILLGRGGVHAAPWYHQFDAYRGAWVKGKLRGGARNPLQRLRQMIGLSAMRALPREAVRGSSDRAVSTHSEIEAILDLARWAPSGDNSQPWRFRIESDDRVTVLVTSEVGNIYEYNNGQPIALGAGFLLESMRIAASASGRSMSWHCERAEIDGAGSLRLELDVRLPKDASVRPDPLLGFVKIRSVDRTPYRRDALTNQQKTLLAQALGPELNLTFFESWQGRWAVARLGARATDIRLRAPEAYEVHRRVIDWERRFSAYGMPSTAIGVNKVTATIMRWAMASWSRVDFMNRFGGGTGLAQLELDMVPGLSCAGHFTIGRRSGATTTPSIEELLRAGERIQRFWLTTTSLGLAMQPSVAPLAFATYGRAGTPFTRSRSLIGKAAQLGERVQEVTGAPVETLVFMGRLGRPRSTLCESRSHRLALNDLIVGRAEGGAQA